MALKLNLRTQEREYNHFQAFLIRKYIVSMPLNVLLHDLFLNIYTGPFNERQKENWTKYV